MAGACRICPSRTTASRFIASRMLSAPGASWSLYTKRASPKTRLGRYRKVRAAPGFPSWYRQQTLDAIHHPAATIGAFPLPGQNKFEGRSAAGVRVYPHDLFRMVVFNVDRAQI